MPSIHGSTLEAAVRSLHFGTGAATGPEGNVGANRGRSEALGALAGHL